MTSVILGDIIRSQKARPELWLKILKSELKQKGTNPKNWDVFRGDSFEVEEPDPSLSLFTAVRIKAAIKTIRNIDVRMSIGIGEKTYVARRITESNGPVFVNSSGVFDNLVREKQNLAIASPWKDFDNDMNLLLKFALIAMDNWSVKSAEVVHLAMSNPGKLQNELGEILGIRQNAVSNRLKRARFAEVSELLHHFQKKIKELAE